MFKRTNQQIMGRKEEIKAKCKESICTLIEEILSNFQKEIII
jgi:hypothetical protein